MGKDELGIFVALAFSSASTAKFPNIVFINFEVDGMSSVETSHMRLL